MGRATDYSNCYIYHFVDSDKVVHYVGSTSNMNSRKSKHKYACKTEHCKEYNFDIYKYIRANGDWDAFEMVPIRKLENISNKTELRIAEQEEINKFTTLKNKYGSYVSPEQHVANGLEATRIWRKNNPQKYFESSRLSDRKYYEANSEKVLQYQRKWRQENAEKLSQYRRKYRESNRDEINKKKCQYRLRQKELKEQDQ
tara:strand:+ start:218 stop:814 length:597 start_codon:yes stop_codon:yes gene_type:complete